MRVYRDRARSRWYIDVRDPHGQRHRLAGFTDKGATEEFARKVERLVSLRSAHASLPPELAAWVTGLHPTKRAALVRVGALDPRTMDGTRPLSELVEEFRESVRARGRSAKHVALMPKMALRLLEGSGAQRWHEIDAGAVEAWMLRQQDEGLTVATCNRYAQAARQFTRWMVSRGRAASDPLATLRKAPEHRQRDRRALTPEEARRLIGAAPPERALVYRVALETGLRLGELRALRPGWVRGETLTVPARSAKSGKAATLPLRPSTARVLAGLPQDGLGLSWHGWAARAVREDAKAAGVSTDGLDFHALRHAYVTWLSGVAQPHVAQGLARHSTADLTMRTYTHVRPAEHVAAILALPSMEDAASGQVEAAATCAAIRAAAAVCLSATRRRQNRPGDTVRAWRRAGAAERSGFENRATPRPNWRSLHGLSAARRVPAAALAATAAADLAALWPLLTDTERAEIAASLRGLER